MTRALPRGVDADADADRFPFIDLPDDALSASLSRWWEVMGAPWFGTPGTAGADALETRIKSVRTWHADWTLPAGPFDRAAEMAYKPQQWNRLDGWSEQYRHGYDITRMYSTAAGITEVAPGGLRRGPREFDKSLAGWWRVELSPWQWAELPDPAGYPTRRHRDGEARWLTTPTVKLLDDLERAGRYGGFSVLDSRVSKGRPVFKEWNQGLERLYREGGPEMRAAVKAAGRETIGLLNSPTYSTRRPDWHHAVIAQARANLFRKIAKAHAEGRPPLLVDTDCVWYGSDDPDPVTACPPVFTLGDGPGQMKHKGTVTK